MLCVCSVRSSNIVEKLIHHWHALDDYRSNPASRVEARNRIWCPSPVLPSTARKVGLERHWMDKWHLTGKNNTMSVIQSIGTHAGSPYFVSSPVWSERNHISGVHLRSTDQKLRNTFAKQHLSEYVQPVLWPQEINTVMLLRSVVLIYSSSCFLSVTGGKKRAVSSKMDDVRRWS